MKKNESIIRVIKDKTPVDNKRIAMITGQRSYPKPTYYENRETGDLYSHISGGIAWPGNGMPGFAIVVAVDKTDDTEPTFRVLEELEERSIETLLNECVALREKYGYSMDKGLLAIWWGDYERFMPLMSDFNEKLRIKDRAKNPFLISPPPDFDKPNNFEIYFNRIESCLNERNAGKVRLIIGGNNKLRNHLINQPPDASSKSVDDYPAISALGYVVHALMTVQPWKQPVRYVEKDFEQYALEEYDSLSRYSIGGRSYYEDDDFSDDGDLIGTID